MSASRPGTEGPAEGRPAADRIIVADDHWLVRVSLVQIVGRIAPRATVVEAADYRQLAAQVATVPADHILLDLRMPGLANWRAEAPKIVAGLAPGRVIIISGLEEPDYIQRLVLAGAVGFIPKRYEHHQMISTLRFLFDGGTYFPPDIVSAAPKPAALLAGAGLTASGLTRRQLDVLSLIGQGLPNKQIASRLALSEATVKVHLNAIYKALGLTNRTEAALAARSLGPGLAEPI